MAQVISCQKHYYVAIWITGSLNRKKKKKALQALGARHVILTSGRGHPYLPNSVHFSTVTLTPVRLFPDFPPRPHRRLRGPAGGASRAQAGQRRPRSSALPPRRLRPVRPAPSGYARQRGAEPAAPGVHVATPRDLLSRRLLAAPCHLEWP